MVFYSQNSMVRCFMGRGKKTTFLKLWLGIFGITALILGVFWLPWLTTNIGVVNSKYVGLRSPLLIGVYISAIPFYVALYQALKLLNLIERNDAFSELAVKSLKLIKHCAGTIILLYAIGLNALEIKTENDLTV